MLEKLTNVLIKLDITLTLPQTICVQLMRKHYKTWSWQSFYFYLTTTRVKGKEEKKAQTLILACKQVILRSFMDHNTAYVWSHSLTFSIPERETIRSILSRPHMWLPDVQIGLHEAELCGVTWHWAQL